MNGLAARQRARSVGAKNAATARTGGWWAGAGTWPRAGGGKGGHSLPGGPHPDGPAGGIAEADRIGARREIVEFLGRLQDLRAGVAQLAIPLVALGATFGRYREPQRARP